MALCKGGRWRGSRSFAVRPYVGAGGRAMAPIIILVMVLFVWQNGKSWYKCRFSCFKSRTVDPTANFMNLVSPITLPKNDRHDLKMGCTDASRRQLQSVLKIGV